MTTKERKRNVADDRSWLNEESPMFEAWLKCFIFKGMFSDERAVKVLALTGSEASFFVPESAVSGAIDHEGRVKVKAYRDGETVWAVLPTENRATIPVKNADVAPTT